jgi:hypothetical protein
MIFVLIFFLFLWLQVVAIKIDTKEPCVVLYNRVRKEYHWRTMVQLTSVRENELRKCQETIVLFEWWIWGKKNLLLLGDP